MKWTSDSRKMWCIFVEKKNTNTMTYIVMTKGRKGMYLFLVDRRKIKNRWWSTDWSESIQFQKESAAKIQAAKLKYKSPKVISIDNAIELSKENDKNVDYESSIHPFSSDALGQY